MILRAQTSGAAPPPSGPVVDAANPDFNGIFTTLDESGSRPTKPRQGRKYYRVGYRTVGWKAEDPNEDALRFSVVVEHVDGHRLPVRKNLDGTQLAVDTTALPDGQYRFEITATDASQNPGSELETTATSRWFTVDNTQPVVTLRRSGAVWTASVVDTGSAIARSRSVNRRG